MIRIVALVGALTIALAGCEPKRQSSPTEPPDSAGATASPERRENASTEEPPVSCSDRVGDLLSESLGDGSGPSPMPPPELARGTDLTGFSMGRGPDGTLEINFGTEGHVPRLADEGERLIFVLSTESRTRRPAFGAITAELGRNRWEVRVRNDDDDSEILVEPEIARDVLNLVIPPDFVPSAMRKRFRWHAFSEWHTGGKVYSDYCPNSGLRSYPARGQTWPEGPFGHNCVPEKAGGRGDFDGDGSHDLVRFDPVFKNSDLSGWVLHQRYGDGDRITTKVDAECPEVIGASDVDQDGGEELFFDTGNGMTAALVDLLVYRAGQLRQVDYRPKLTKLYVGGSNAGTSDLRCYLAKGLPILEINRVDPVEQRVTATTYVLTDGTLHKTGTKPIRGDAAGELRCFGLLWKGY